MRLANSFKKSFTFLNPVLLCSALLLSSSVVMALPADRQQQISLLADHATYNDKTGVTTYSGNVVIEQGTMKINAGSIVAQLNKSKQMSLVTANGSPAKFQQQLETNRGIARGEAKKIVYNAETGILTLTGDAYLYQDGSSFRSNILKYSMNKGDIEASGGPSGSGNGRLQIIIPPSASKTFPGVRD